MDSEPYYLASRKSWYIKTIGDNGKRSQKKIGNTKKEAKAYLDAVRREQERAEAANGLLLLELVEQWATIQLTRVERGEVTESWLVRRMSMLTRFLNDSPDLSCEDLKPFVLLDWIAKQGWKPNTERMLLTVAKQILR